MHNSMISPLKHISWLLYNFSNPQFPHVHQCPGIRVLSCHSSQSLCSYRTQCGWLVSSASYQQVLKALIRLYNLLWHDTIFQETNRKEEVWNKFAEIFEMLTQYDTIPVGTFGSPVILPIQLLHYWVRWAPLQRQIQCEWACTKNYGSVITIGTYPYNYQVKESN